MNFLKSLFKKKQKITIDHLMVPFKAAVINGNLEDIKSLVNQFPNLIDPAYDDNYAIQWASRNGHLDIVKYFINNTAASGTHTPTWELHNYELKTVQRVNNQFPNIDPAANHNCAIRWASMNGHLEVVKYLISIQPKFPMINPGAAQNWAIHYASKKGHLEVVKYLISIRPEFPTIDPAAYDNYAIKCASENGYLEVVKYLISIQPQFPGIDPAADNNYAIRFAASNGHLEVVKFLISIFPQFPCIDPAAYENYAIRWAVCNGHLEVVDFLNGISNKKPKNSIQSEEKTQDDTKIKVTKDTKIECPVCMENEANFVTKCGHLFCYDCADKVDICPTCRSKIKGLRRVYI